MLPKRPAKARWASILNPYDLQTPYLVGLSPKSLLCTPPHSFTPTMCSRYLASCLYAAVIASLVSSSAAARQRGLTAVNTASGSAAALPLEPRPTTANCSELFFEQRVDQFDFNGDAPTWQQRYFLCPQFANGSGTAAPPILFLGAVAAASAAALIPTVKWYGGAHHMPNCTCSHSRQRGGRAESRKHQRTTVGAGPRPGRPARVCRGEQKGANPSTLHRQCACPTGRA